MNEQRLIDIETSLTTMEKTLDELNKVVYEQGLKIDSLMKINKYLLDMLDKDALRPLSEETPPPHY